MSKISKKNIVSTIIAILFFCYSITGLTISSNIYISFTLFVFWVVLTLFFDTNSFISNFISNKKLFALWIYLLFLFITSLIEAEGERIIKTLGETVLLFSPMIIFSYYYHIRQIGVLKKIAIISGVYYLIIVLNANIFYINNPIGGRILASNEYALGVTAIGGGYGLAYVSSLLAVFFFDILQSNFSNKKNRVLLLLIILLLSLLVINTRSTITILALFIGLATSLILRRPKKLLTGYKSKFLFRIRQIILLSIIFLSTILFVIYSKEIGHWILNRFPYSDNVVVNRLKEIGYFLAYQQSEGSMDARILMLHKSLSGFSSETFFGEGWKYGYAFYLSKDYIGNHSEWLDALARLGIIGSLPFFLIFWYSIKEERLRVGRLIPPSYVLVLFFLGLLNPFQTFQSMYVLLFLIPAIGLIILEKLNNKYQLN